MSATLRLAPIAVMLLVAVVVACDSTASTPTGSASPAPTGTASAAAATPQPFPDAGVILEEFPPGGPRNEVRLENGENNRFMARASIRLHRIEGDEVRPVNVAFAQASCSDCQTVAVAVQIAFYRRGAPIVEPQNIALAANINCHRCVTAARAIQYVIPVDDPKQDVPDEVKSLVRDIDRELRFLASVRTLDQLTSDQAEARIQRVLDQYADLQGYLQDLIRTERAENASPTPTATATTSAAPTPSLTPSPTVTPPCHHLPRHPDAGTQPLLFPSWRHHSVHPCRTTRSCDAATSSRLLCTRSTASSWGRTTSSIAS